MNVDLKTDYSDPILINSPEVKNAFISTDTVSKLGKGLLLSGTVLVTIGLIGLCTPGTQLPAIPLLIAGVVIAVVGSLFWLYSCHLSSEEDQESILSTSPQSQEEIFFQAVKEGAKKLLKDGIHAAFDWKCYSCLLFELFYSRSITIWTPVRADFPLLLKEELESTKILFSFACLKNAEGSKAYGKGVGEHFLGVKNSREKQGSAPLSTVFFPLIAPGSLKHAVLIVVEFDDQDPSAVYISIIDSFGEKSGYQKTSKAFVQGLEEAFSSLPNQHIVSNKVVQQTDGLTCGFQQLLNIEDLLEKDDVYNFVAQNRLPARPQKSIERFLEELKPSLEQRLSE